MAAIFPSEEWLQGLKTKLNSDARYNEIAKNWEGDLFFFIEPEGNLKEKLTFYLDLWHGTCRKVEYQPARILSKPHLHIDRFLQGHHFHPDRKTQPNDRHDDIQS